MIDFLSRLIEGTLAGGDYHNYDCRICGAAFYTQTRAIEHVLAYHPTINNDKPVNQSPQPNKE